MPAEAMRSSSSRTPLGLVRQHQVIAAQSRQRPVQRRDPDRGRLDDLGAERAQPRGEPARLRTRARDRDADARQRPILEPAQALAQRRHLAEHRDRGRADPLLLGARRQCSQRRRHHALAGERAALDDRRRLRRRRAAGDQLLGDRGQPADAHVDHERPREGRQRAPVQRRLGLGRDPRARSRTRPRWPRRDGSRGCRRRRARRRPAVTPGTTSNGMPAARSASASSPPRPNTNGSPPLRRTTDCAGAPVLHEQRSRSPPGRPTGRRPPCPRRAAGRRHEPPPAQRRGSRRS